MPSATTTAPLRSTIDTFFETKTASDIVGDSNGGGFEWTASPAADSLAGVTALELDADGVVTRITSVYDSRQLERDRKAGLTGAAFAP